MLDEQTQSPNIFFGINVVEEIIKNRRDEIDRIYFDKDVRSARLFEVLKLCKKNHCHYQMVPTIKLDNTACSPRHQGVVAICAARTYLSTEQLLALVNESPAPPLLLIPASIEDPGNLGALIRSAVAFGVTAIMLEKKNSVPMNATVARASAGMLEHMPVAKPHNLEGLIATLKEKGFTIVGVEQDPVAVPVWESKLAGPMVLVLGGENLGIPPYLKKLCSAVVNIPMPGKAPSLNVSAAGAIVLCECAKQRATQTSNGRIPDLGTSQNSDCIAPTEL